MLAGGPGACASPLSLVMMVEKKEAPELSAHKGLDGVSGWRIALTIYRVLVIYRIVKS